MAETNKPAPKGEAPPTVIVDDLHVTYRTYASGRQMNRRLRVGRSGLRGIREVRAVRGISFVAREGETIGLIGHNGSGKSTTLRAMAGLYPATAGRVFASSRPALLGVNAALLQDLTGERNVILGLLALGFSRREAEQRCPEVLDFAGMTEFKDLPMRTYSSGMSARLRFSIAVAREVQILLVDEALAVGDKEFLRRSEQRIRELRQQAGTVFLVSHSMDSILDTCNRVIWLDHGEIKMDGDPETVVAAYQAES